MNLYPYIRRSIFLAAALAATLSVAAPANRPQVQAQLLDHAEFLCADCFFGASNYYYCFAADNKVLIGYQKTWVLTWLQDPKNYLAEVRPEWAVWSAPSQTVPISYDDKHIWVSRANGKQVRLTRSSLRDIFTNNDQCRGADRANAH